MSRYMLAGIFGLMAMAGLGSAPAAAWDECDCLGYRHYGYAYADHGYYVVAHAPPVLAYDYEPRVFAYYADPRDVHGRFHSRWRYVAPYGPPRGRIYALRPYGYAYVSRGPAVLVHRYAPRAGWRRRW